MGCLSLMLCFRLGVILAIATIRRSVHTANAPTKPLICEDDDASLSDVVLVSSVTLIVSMGELKHLTTGMTTIWIAQTYQ